MTCDYTAQGKGKRVTIQLPECTHAMHYEVAASMLSMNISRPVSGTELGMKFDWTSVDNNNVNTQLNRIKKNRPDAIITFAEIV
jgi:hypothetical protein